VSWLKNAFALDPPGPVEPTPQQQPIIDRICREIARRHLTTPGLIVLEMIRPLNYLGSQAMHFLEPAVWAVLSKETHVDYQQFALFLEHRGSMDYLCRRIEHFEHEFEQREQGGATETTGDESGPDDAAAPTKMDPEHE
jgi:hypothetical protein